jgi:hypothetical protein
MKSQPKTKKNYWVAYNYPQNKAVGDKLRNGDREVIHDITGYSMSYIYDVLTGKRKNDSIIEVANEIISIREKAITNLQKKILLKAS